MMDDVDEIQYIGSRPAFANALTSATPFSTHFHRQPQSSADTTAGIVLHVESNGKDEPANSLTFRKATTRVIHIGRRPGSDSLGPNVDNDGMEKGRAMFRCAVVSRKHARISFSESGNAYLADVGSHHGTHLRRSSDTILQRLEPGKPVLLSDGDVVTFGKSVGRNNEIVQPVVARVELLLPQIKPLVVPGTSSPPTPLRRTGSGRYGLYPPIVPSPTSSDSSSSSSQSQSHSSSLSSSEDSFRDGMDLSDNDSGIEEIPCPSSQNSGVGAGSATAIAFRRLKRLLPSIVSAREVSNDLGRPVDDVPADGDSVRNITPPIVVDGNSKSRSHSPMELESPAPGPTSLPFMRWLTTPPVPSINHDLPASFPFESAFPATDNSPDGPSTAEVAGSNTGAIYDDRHDDHSVSEEPSTSGIAASDTGANYGDSSDDGVDEPNVQEGSSQQLKLPTLPDVAPLEPPFPRFTPMTFATPPWLMPPHTSTPSGFSFCGRKDKAPEPQTPINPPLAVEALRKEFVERIERECRRVSSEQRIRSEELQHSIDEGKRLVEENQERLAELEDRLSEMTPNATGNLVEQVDQVMKETIPTMQADLSTVRGSVEDLQRERDRLVEELKTLRPSPGHSTLDEMTKNIEELRIKWQSQIAGELERVQQARTKAMEALNSYVAEVEAIPARSLKRKHADRDDDTDPDATSNDPFQPHRGQASTLVSNSSGIDVPSPKRYRPVLAQVAHTATVMTVGAVAAWSMLAFS